VRKIACLAIVPAALVSAAAAHDGRPHGFDDLYRYWNFDPVIVVFLVLSAGIYAAGLVRLWNAGGRGHGISKGSAGLYLLGWLSLAAALVSPLHQWGEVLFAAHMTQHEILMLVSAPLIVMGRPFIAAIWAVPESLRPGFGQLVSRSPIKTAWRQVTKPWAAWAIHAVVLWAWHIPALFQTTLDSWAIHTLQHASFFFSALLFWWAIIYNAAGRASYGAGVLYLFTTSIQSGLLGVFLTLTTRLWYPAYSATVGDWGFTPLEDQQLGGLIMWIPAGIIYTFAALVMFASWMRASERRVAKGEAGYAQ
jgi:putative membrane protein